MPNQAKYTKISEEDLSDAPKGRWLKAITEPLSEQLTVNKGLMDSGLTFKDNIKSESKDFVVEVPDPWVALTPENGYAAASFSCVKHPNGVVELRGSVGGGAAPPIAITTLPVGYRPFATEHYAIPSAGAFGEVVVAPTGIVTLQVGAAAIAWVSGVRFLASDSTPIRNIRFPLFMLTSFTSPVLGVIITKIEDLTSGQPMPIGSVHHLDWEYVNASQKPNIKINNVTGLPYNRKYRISILILGE